MKASSNGIFRNPVEILKGVVVYQVEDSYRAMRKIRWILDKEKGAAWNHWPFASRAPAEQNRMFVLEPEMIMSIDPKRELTPDELEDDSYDPFMLNSYYIWTQTRGFRWYACFVDGRLAAFKNDMTLSGWYCEDGLMHMDPPLYHRPGAVPERRLHEAFVDFNFKRDVFTPDDGHDGMRKRMMKFLEMSENPDVKIRARIAMADYSMATIGRNTKVVQDMLDRLADDPDPDVRMAVARNRSISGETHERLRHDRDWRVRLMICSTPIKPSFQDGVFCRDRSFEVRLMCAMSMNPDRYFDRKACTTLLHDERPEVRFALAFMGLEGHPHDQKSILVEMAMNDPDERIRSSAAIKLLEN